MPQFSEYGRTRTVRTITIYHYHYHLTNGRNDAVSGDSIGL
jgi:hypothetical protein